MCVCVYILMCLHVLLLLLGVPVSVSTLTPFIQDWHAMLLVIEQLTPRSLLQRDESGQSFHLSDPLFIGDLLRTGDFSRDSGGTARMLFEVR